jgi:hypothetical protein
VLPLPLLLLMLLLVLLLLLGMLPLVPLLLLLLMLLLALGSPLFSSPWTMLSSCSSTSTLSRATAPLAVTNCAKSAGLCCCCCCPSW